MPRKKLIDEDNIRFEKIDLDIIEKKNCLGVKLVFNAPWEPRQLHTMQTYYKITTDETGLTAVRSTKNSWKGLVMLLLSLTYCKYGSRIIRTILDRPYSKGRKYKSYLPISNDFTTFLDEKILSDIQTEAMVCTPDEMILSILPETKEQQREIFKQRRKERKKEALIKLPPQPYFEQIPAPPSWKAYYLEATFSTEDVLGDMMVLAERLDLNIKNSIVITDYYKTVPYNYTTVPAKFQDVEGLLCSCHGEFISVHGIEIVDDERFSSLQSKNYVEEIDPSIPPERIGKKETLILGYNICDHTIQKLCAYFPFMESEFYNALTTMGGSAWVVFDSKYLGKWG